MELIGTREKLEVDYRILERNIKGTIKNCTFNLEKGDYEENNKDFTVYIDNVEYKSANGIVEFEILLEDEITIKDDNNRVLEIITKQKDISEEDRVSFIEQENKELKSNITNLEQSIAELTTLITMQQTP